MTNLFEHGGGVFALARALGVRPEELLDFSANINPLGPAPGVRGAVFSAFDRVVHYPDRETVALRRALADYHGLDPACIVAANGSTELICLLPRLLPGRRGLIVAPAFSEYAHALDRAGWKIEYFTLSPADGFRLCPETLAKRLAQGVDLLFLCNPANPTGVLLHLAEVERVFELCRRSGTFLVLDEAFMDFCEEESAKGLITASGGGVVLRSLTKFHAIPGLRLGYAVGEADFIGRCAGMMDPWSVNTLAQTAGIAALADTGYRERTLRLVSAERDTLFRGLSALPGLKPLPSAANYLLVEICCGFSAEALRDRLLTRRILIRDCSNYQGLDHRFFRVAVRTGEENRRLLTALSEVLSETAG